MYKRVEKRRIYIWYIQRLTHIVGMMMTPDVHDQHAECQLSKYKEIRKKTADSQMTIYHKLKRGYKICT